VSFVVPAAPPPPGGGPSDEVPALLGTRDDLVHAVLDTVDVGIVACDADGHLVLFNEAARRFHGRPPDASVLPDQWTTCFDLYRADGRTPLPLDEVPLQRVLRDGAVNAAEIVIAPAGRPPVTVQCTGTQLRDGEGRLTGAVCVMTDVTALRASEQRLRTAHEATARSESQFRHAFERGPTPMCRLDADGVVQQLNPALRRLVARPTSSVLGRRLVTLVAPADREQLEVCLAAALSPEIDVDLVEVRLRRPDESTVWCELAVSTSTDEHGAPMLLVQLADVDARRRREQELERRASQDPLTGLPNRAALLRVLAERLAPSSAQRAPSLLFLDLDAFKQVNDDATASGTRCWSRWPAGSRTPCGPATSWPAWAVTSSSSSSMPARVPSRSRRNSYNGCTKPCARR
jgi:PAS domain S-box-containing protein